MWICYLCLHQTGLNWTALRVWIVTQVLPNTHVISRRRREKQWDAKTQGAHPWQQHRRSCMCHHHAAEISCNGSSCWGLHLLYGTFEATVVEHYLQNITGNAIVYSEHGVNCTIKLIRFSLGSPGRVSGMKWSEMKLFLCITLNISLKHFADARFYNTLIIPSFSPSHFERTGQMTSVENIDLNGNACSSLSKSVGSPSVEENNTLFCRSLWKCHYTSCLRPNAHHSHSAGCWNTQKQSETELRLGRISNKLFCWYSCVKWVQVINNM